MNIGRPGKTSRGTRRMVAAATTLAVSATTLVVPVTPLGTSFEAAAQTTVKEYKSQLGNTNNLWMANIFGIGGQPEVKEVFIRTDLSKVRDGWGEFPAEARYLALIPGRSGQPTVGATGYGQKSGTIHTLRVVFDSPVKVPSGQSLQVRTYDGTDLPRGWRTVPATTSVYTTSDMGALAGTVKDEAGNPVTGGRISLHRLSPNATQTLEVKADGTFSADLLAPGNYRARVEQGENYPASSWQPFEVSAEQTSQIDLTVALDRGAVAANVAGAKPGTTVKISGGEYSTPQTMPAANGRYELSNVLPGTYTITAQAPQGYETTPASRQITLTAADVAAGRVPEVNFSTNASTVTAKITVADDTGTAVPSAKVSLQENAGSRTYTATADSNGVATFTSVQPGEYRFAVAGVEGRYKGVGGPLSVKEAATTTGTATVPTLNRLNGNVRGDDGKQVAGAKVHISGGPDGVGFQATTNSNGTWDAGTLPAGRYTLRVESPSGYQDLQPQTVQVAAGQPATKNFTVKAVRGSVEAKTSGPVSPTAVWLTGGPLNTRTDLAREGSVFRAADVLPGTYRVQAEAPTGYSVVPTPRQITVRSGETAPLSIDVNANPVTAAFTVRDNARGTVSGASVTLNGPGITRTETTTNDGTVRFQGLQPGPYTVTVESTDDYAGISQPVQVRPAAGASAELRVGLLDEVSFTLLDDQGNPIEEATGSVDGMNRNIEFRNGSATLSGVPEGTYTITVPGREGYYAATQKQFTVTADQATKPQELTVALESRSVKVTLNGRAEGVEAVRLSDGTAEETLQVNGNTATSAKLKPGTYTVSVETKPGFRVTQKVRDVEVRLDGNLTPVPVQFEIQVAPGSIAGHVLPSDAGATATITGTGQTLQADENGAYHAADLAPGTYTVKVEAEGYVPQEVEVQIKAGEETSFGPIELALKDGSITGEVTTKGGEAVPDTVVEIVDANGNPAQVRDAQGAAPTTPLTLNSQGMLEPVYLQPGTYTVRVLPPEGYRPVREQQVEVEPGKPTRFNVAPLEIVPRTVTGLVADSKNNPVPDVRVELRRAGGDPIVGAIESGTQLTFTGVMPGEYEVHAIVPADSGYIAPAPRPLTVGIGEGAVDAGPIWVHTLGQIRGLVTDTSGNPVPQVSIELIDATGEPAASTINPANGEVTAAKLQPGRYTLTARADGYESGQRTVLVEDDKVAGFEPIQLAETKQDPPPVPDQFDWETIAVSPGTVELVPPSRAEADPESVTFEIVDAPVDWITVQPDGLIVARPPYNADRGEYTVEVETSAGERNTITVKVAEPKMAERYTVRFPVVAVPAGTTRMVGTPRASVVDGSFVYQDRALPAGTTFEVQHDWVKVENGRLQLTPPTETPAGVHQVKVTVIFPDGSSTDVEVPITIGDPLLADTVELGFESGLSVAPGGTVAVARTGTSVLPEGTTFAIDSDADLAGWSASVEAATGALRVTAPANVTQPVKVPVTAYFTDGSTSGKMEIEVGVASAKSAAAQTTLAYAETQSVRGSRVTVGIEGQVPEGATFVVVDDGGWPVGVDKQTGALQVNVPVDAALDEAHDVVVQVRYGDGSAKQLTAKVGVQSQASRHAIEFSGENVEVGQAGELKPAGQIPPGTMFDVAADANQPGWTVSIDERTGTLMVRSDASVPEGQEARVPVRMTFADGSTAVIEVPVRAVASPEPEPEPEPEQPVEPTVETTRPEAEGSSLGKGTIAIILGVIAVVAGTGAFVFFNQDEIRRIVNQYGIRI